RLLELFERDLDLQWHRRMRHEPANITIHTAGALARTPTPGEAPSAPEALLAAGARGCRSRKPPPERAPRREARGSPHGARGAPAPFAQSSRSPSSAVGPRGCPSREPG